MLRHEQRRSEGARRAAQRRVVALHSTLFRDLTVSTAAVCGRRYAHVRHHCLVGVHAAELRAGDAGAADRRRPRSCCGTRSRPRQRLQLAQRVVARHRVRGAVGVLLLAVAGCDNCAALVHRLRLHEGQGVPPPGEAHAAAGAAGFEHAVSVSGIEAVSDIEADFGTPNHLHTLTLYRRFFLAKFI